MSGFATRSASALRTWQRICLLLLLLAAGNATAWIWAISAFQSFPLLIGTALLAYSFGLRHAVDADHIAAIDNITRKLMQDGQRPICVGLFFSLGHASVVMLASVAVALATSAFKDQLLELQVLGGVVGSLVSASFLLAIALANTAVLAMVVRTFRRTRAGGGLAEQDMDLLLAGGGLLARLFRPLFRVITRSWHMFPLGLLFGLGFDTATEVGLLGISAAEATNGLPVWSILVFPALFTAGMALVDTLDSMLMLGAYGWAFINPVRKLYYNIAITAASVALAAGVGGLELLNLAGKEFNLKGLFWDFIGSLNDNFNAVGCIMIGLCAFIWIASVILYRIRGYDTPDLADPSVRIARSGGS
jgi:high-affinity nickel-transport protein